MRFSHCLAVVSATLLPTAAKGQIGTVRDTAGVPVVGASVEAFSATRLLARALTDNAGSFRLPRVQDVERLTVGRLGYATAVIQSPPDSLEVVLEVEPIAVEGVSVLLPRLSCPTKDEAAARLLLSTSADRYSPETFARGVAAVVRRHRHWTTTRSDSPDLDVELSRASPAIWAWVGARDLRTPGRFLHADSIIAKERYSWPDEASPFASPSLAQRHSYHFIGSLFRQLHDFTFISQDARRSVIGYCPRRGGRDKTIEGIIEVSADGSLAFVRWTAYRSGRAVYGGETVFAPIPSVATELPHLTVIRARTWQATPRSGSAYLLWAWEADEWRVGGTEDVPDVSDMSRRWGLRR